MQTTDWYTPRSFTLETVDDGDIGWLGDISNLPERNMLLDGLVSHKVNSSAGSVGIRNKTQKLILTNFNITSTLDYIELELTTRKNGRVVDETISLYSNGVIGKNMADYFDTANVKSYKGSLTEWELLTPVDFTSSDFGVCLRFQANFTYPHKDGFELENVRLRFYQP